MMIKKLFEKVAAVVLSVCLVGGATGIDAPLGFAVNAEEASVISIGTYEVEDLNNVQLWTSLYETLVPGFNGEGFVYLMNEPISFYVNAPENGSFNISIRSIQLLNQEGRMQTIVINGKEHNFTMPYADEWTNIELGPFQLNQGLNEVSFTGYYGYMALDRITIGQESTTESTRLFYLSEEDNEKICKWIDYPNKFNDLLTDYSSINYCPELANMLCVMAQSAYSEECVRANYNELGFKNQTAVYDYETTYTQDDNCGYVIGYQDLKDGTREFLITVRGTASDILTEFYKPPFGDPAEWFSDFNLGFGQINPWAPCPDYHDGFEAAADRIYESLQKYNDGTIRTKKVRYVLTGHSRGAAVSDIVSKWLIDSGVSKNDLYSYNFACPGTAIDKESEFTSSKYISIFNLNCARDLVGQAPGEKLTLLSIPFLGTMGSKDPAQWGKYGQTYFWDADWDSSKSASVTELGTYHPCDKNYIPYFSQQNELSEFKTFYDMKNIQDSNWYKPRTVTLVKQINIFPPFESKVGATISDATGNIVATLKNGILEIVSGMEDKMIGNIGDDGVIQIAVDSSEEYQVNVTSDEPVTIAVAQGNQNYNSVNNGAVYTAAPGNTTIDITPDTPAAETPVTGGNGKAIEPDKVWNLGDVNGDRSANIADAVLLQKWLLNKPDSDLTEWTAADIYEDGKLNVYDLTLLKQLITE